MRVPHRLMIHKIDHYAQSITRVKGEDQAVWNTLTHGNIPANVQEAQPEIVEQYKARELRLKQSAFIVNGTVAAAIHDNDQIEFRGKRYGVAGVVNLSNRDCVWRIDLAEVLS